VFALALLFAVAGPAGEAAAASAAPVAAKNGMVVTAQHLASEVGVEVLKKGGNAIDAAVAVGYALAVVYPAAGNLGGGGFMTLQLADGRKTFFDFREKAPLAATPNMFLDAAGNVVRGATTTGHLAVAVPGTVPASKRRAKVRDDEACRADRAGDPPRRAGLRARTGRRRHVRERVRGAARRSGDGGDLPQQGSALGRRRAPGAA
jgi:hypothetical protein